MARGRQERAWDHTATLISWLAAVNGQTVDAASVHPFMGGRRDHVHLVPMDRFWRSLGLAAET